LGQGFAETINLLRRARRLRGPVGLRRAIPGDERWAKTAGMAGSFVWFAVSEQRVAWYL